MVLCAGDGQAGEDGKAAVAGETAIAPGIARLAPAAIAVKVIAAVRPGIGAGGKKMGVGGARRVEGGESRAGCVPVDIREHEDVGVCFGDDGEGGGDLGIVAFEDVAQEESGAVTAERGGEGGDAQGFGAGTVRKGKRQRKGRQAWAELCCGVARAALSRCLEIMSATWLRAMPRIRRLAGRNAHAVTVQIRVW